MYRILIVEDDATIVEVLERQLGGWHYIVRSVRHFDKVMEEFGAFEPHLILLDITLPFYNGYYWCTEIRKKSRVPIVFISSAGDDMSLVTAIHMGADDFIPKPFRMDVAVAKIQAILRRTYDFGTDPQALSHRGVTLYLQDATLQVGEKRVELSKNEFRILQVLLENKGRTVSREELMQRLWETESFIDDNTLTVNVTRLRKRLESVGVTDFIRTKKGLGYIVEE